MRIEIKTASYNSRRYGRPWVALVTFDVMGKPQYAWGNWIGRPGDAGTLVVQANPGDIVAEGQRDNRGGNTGNQWYLVAEDGTLSAINRVHAWQHWTARLEMA